MVVVRRSFEDERAFGFHEGKRLRSMMDAVCFCPSERLLPSSCRLRPLIHTLKYVLLLSYPLRETKVKVFGYRARKWRAGWLKLGGATKGVFAKRKYAVIHIL